MPCRLLLAVSLLFVCCVSLLAEEKDSPSPAETTSKPKVIKLFDGKSLDGWKINKEGFYSEPGEVSIKNGELHLGKGSPATGIVFTKQPPKMNYELSLEAKRTEGGDFFCGLTFPVGSKHQTLIVGGWGGGVTGLSNIDGMSAVENETTGYTEFENDRWYKIRVRVTPEFINVWIDKDSIIDFEIADHRLDIWIEQDTSKPLGIGTWNTGSALRKIQIKPIEKAPK